MLIKNMRRISNGNSKIKAFFSVEWPGKFTLNEFKLVEGEKGIFIAAPSREYTDKTGKKKYQPLVYLESEELRDKIQTAALQAYRADK